MRVFNGPEFADYKREAYRASGDYFKYCPDGNPCDAGEEVVTMGGAWPRRSHQRR